MLSIHTLLIGTPRTITDEKGAWRSAIYRNPVAGPTLLAAGGLEGDQVADTAHHGSPDQAVCCHPLAHYDDWNREYGLETPEARLGPGSVGENWTISGGTEADVCVGDVYAVGRAVVQVSAPRFPCAKQERKLRLEGFLQRTMETLRTGWYLRVLEPGLVQAGDTWNLRERLRPEWTIYRINEGMHRAFDAGAARRLLDVPELASGWKRILEHRLKGS